MADQPDPIDVHIGQQIRARRKMFGISQSALAEGLGVSFQQVQKYERGANRVSGSMLMRTARYLKAPVAIFFPDQDEEAIEGGLSPIDEMVNATGGFELARSYMRMSGQMRASLVKVARAMLEAEEDSSGPIYAAGADPEARRHVA